MDPWVSFVGIKDLDIMQLLDEVEHNIMNYQRWGLSNIWLGWGK